MMVAKEYYTCDWRACGDRGFGLLPIKFIPHYGSDFGGDNPRGPIDWAAAKEMLENYGEPGLPLFDLREGEYAVFEDEKHSKTVRKESVNG